MRVVENDGSIGSLILNPKFINRNNNNNIDMSASQEFFLYNKLESVRAFQLVEFCDNPALFAQTYGDRVWEVSACVG